MLFHVFMSVHYDEMAVVLQKKAMCLYYQCTNAT